MIDRRTFLTSLTAGPVLRAAAAAQTPSTKPASGRKPNVILVITDDQGYGDLGCHGNPSIQTPALDQLHSRSVRFTNFHVSPTCAPTRAALMTGRHNNATGVWHTIMGRSLLRPGEVTMADCFRTAGYRTGIFGKWHLGDNYPCRPQERGFEEVLIHGGGGVWQAPDHFGNDYFDDTYMHNGKPRRFSGHCTDVWFQNAQRFIQQSASSRRPFFCYLSTNAPHSPMWSPERHEALYRNTKGLKEPGFYGMITHLDDNMARLQEMLRKRNLEENTILIFMTDNGTAAGQGVFNAGMRGGKGSPYEGGHRVPFFIHWPAGGVTGGRDVPQLTAHFDVLPTMMDLCGLSRPQNALPMHGSSLRPLLAEAPAKWEDRTIVVDSQRMEHLGKWRQTAVMTQRWRLVSPGQGSGAGSGSGTPKLELYDILADPSQNQDVAATHPETVSRLQREYDAWWDTIAPGSEEPVRIVVGSPAENPLRLSSHDWHSDGALQAWNQGQVRQGPAVNGVWTLHIHQPGTYRFELCRWPKEARTRLSDAYVDAQPNRDKTTGRALAIVSARMRIGSVERASNVEGNPFSVAFEVALPAGPADLQTWLVGPDGAERGAYYVYVNRV